LTGLAIGVDVGGTKLAAGLVAADGTVIDRLRAETPAVDVAAIPPLIARLTTDLSNRQGAERVPVGVGAAGLIDLHGAVRYAPNIAWRDYPLGETLAALLGVPVTVDNDANVAAWAEFCCGAGTEADTMVMLTVGTGVGGGLVIDGRLARGAHGLGAEFGHVIVMDGGPCCPCGNRGCLEAMASGNAIARTARERLDAGTVPDDSLLRRLSRAEVTGKAVTVAAHGGDPAARAVVDQCGFWLGVGMASLANALDPDVIVVGGGAMQAGELLLAPARTAFAERLVGREHRPLTPIVPAALADDAGIIGAALVALEAGRRPPQEERSSG
jgi:glucokinase